MAPRKTLVIACGALAREFLAVKEANGWSHLDVTCLPAIWHNTPQKIPEGVRRKIRAARGNYEEILCLYGDCGTGGLLDRVLEEEGVERIDGDHCYALCAISSASSSRGWGSTGTRSCCRSISAITRGSSISFRCPTRPWRPRRPRLRRVWACR